MIKFYGYEWKMAVKEGNKEYAAQCKEKYRQLVLESLERPYRQYEESLKQYPPIMLN